MCHVSFLSLWLVCYKYNFHGVEFAYFAVEDDLGFSIMFYTFIATVLC